jgi:superfamily II DNA helicase RecQ
MSELKPCKCGETEPCVHLALVYIIDDDEEKYCVMCENCDAETDEYDTAQQAISAWNTRVGD